MKLPYFLQRIISIKKKILDTYLHLIETIFYRLVNAVTTVVKTAKLKFRNFMNQYATSIKD